jgi:hypothetical protein
MILSTDTGSAARRDFGLVLRRGAVTLVVRLVYDHHLLSRLARARATARQSSRSELGAGH